MISVGLITEYNPFHNGHLHHLRESRKVAGAEVAVVLMSGHFLQRGEPALADKWVRAEMALRSGVDLVVELPFPWACNSAPHFALGAVQALSAFGCIDALCFGSEAGELAVLQRCADVLSRQEETVARATEELLKEGMTYPDARARVFAELAGGGLDPEPLRTPNNILGIEYLKALQATGSPIRPLTIRRIGAGYHDLLPVDTIASATAIREMVRQDREITDFIPHLASGPLLQALAAEHTLDSENLHQLLLSKIFLGHEHLRGIYQVDNGLENRLAASADESTGYDELVGAVKSRQLTRTRIQRILAYILLDAKREDMAAFLDCGPLYLHLLGAGPRGRAFLADCRKHLALPLVGNFSRLYPTLKRFYGEGTERYRLAGRMLDYELRATRTYTLLMRNWRGRSRNRDFFEEVIFFGRKGDRRPSGRAKSRLPH
jgi:predicted nucleotidyltransferase